MQSLGLVGRVIYPYRNQPGCEREDLMQAGTIGLIKAVESFDPAKGAWSTFATWQIRAAVQNELLRTGGMIRLPDRWSSQSEKYQGAVAAAQHVGSLDAPVNTGSERGLVSFLEDGSAGERQENAEESEQILRDFAELELVMDTALNEREKLVVGRRFGLGAARAATIVEVGALIGCGKERVRQIEKAALEKLRAAAAGGFVKPDIRIEPKKRCPIVRRFRCPIVRRFRCPIVRRSRRLFWYARPMLAMARRSAMAVSSGQLAALFPLRFCRCGCGAMTNRVVGVDPAGIYKPGEYRRYVAGHVSRVIKPKTGKRDRHGFTQYKRQVRNDSIWRFVRDLVAARRVARDEVYELVVARWPEKRRCDVGNIISGAWFSPQIDDDAPTFAEELAA